MFDLESIVKTYPQQLQKFKRSLLREYLQYKILEIIYTSDFAGELVFLGGTALRIIYNNQRFSEDLDFDNQSLSQEEFVELSNLVKKGLEMRGFTVEIKNVFKEAFRCYIKFPGLLHTQGLSPYEKEKIVIQIDTTPQDFDFDPEVRTLDKFDVYLKILVTPTDIILAQKIYTIFNRQKMKGRDFFDVDFLISNQCVEPNFAYLEQKLNIKNEAELKSRLKNKLREVDFEKLSFEVERFLFNPDHKERVLGFYQSIDEWVFSPFPK